jgi:hypothetical protein
LILFGERHRREIELSRLQPAGGGVALRIPIVKKMAARETWRLRCVQYELNRGWPAAVAIARREPAPDKTHPMSSTLITETLSAPFMTSPLE